jgi:queuosine precursor transporter
MKPKLLISLYLMAIITANLLTTYFGAWFSIINAFVFIGLDLTTRDYLHEIWNKNRWLKMGLLIVSGSILSWLLNKDSGMIAIASFVAFALAAITDTIIYTLLHKKSFIVKCNGSNILSSLVDSITFPTIAFGSFLPLIVLGQFTAKVGGGFIWSLIIRRINHVMDDTRKIKVSKF